MRIYVGTYNKYNSGNIAGAWLNLADYSDKDEFHAACQELHSDEEDPEFMFQDFEGIPEGMVGESHIDDAVFDLASEDEDDIVLFMAYRSNVDQDGTIDDMKEAYRGTYASGADYAEEFYDEGGSLDNVPDRLRMYIDWEHVARDMEYGNTSFVSVADGVAVFVS